MNEKVIYVDFKAASKKNHSNNNQKSDQIQVITHLKPYKDTLLSRLKNLLSRFRIGKSSKSSNIKYKYWL